MTVNINKRGGYKVGFGRTAGTFVYEDNEGTIVFYVGISPAVNPERGKWMIELGHPRTREGKLLQITSSQASRVSFALDKTKEFLLSRGYQIQVI